MNSLLDRTGREVPIALISIGLMLFLYYVGARDFWPTDEDEYGQISREMLRSGNWLLATCNGEPWTIKPVLLNWLIAMIALPWGDVSEFHARFFSSMGALVTFMLTYALGRQVFSPRAGILSALVLGTSLVFLQQSRWAQTYMLSTCFATLSIYCFYTAYTRPERRTLALVGLYVFTALGVLTMGPVNLAMPGLVCFTLLVVQRDLGFMKEMMLVRGTLIFLAIAAPWYVLMATLEDYGFDLFIKTNFTRYVDAWTHSQPFYFYLRDLIWSFAPWSFFLPGALWLAFSERSREHRTGVVLALVWFLSLLLFFSAADGKRPQYLLAAYPAMALLVGYLLDRALANWQDVFFRRSVVIPSLILVGLWVLLSVAGPIAVSRRYPDWLVPVLGASVIAVVFAIAGIVAWRRDRPTTLVVLPAAFVLAMVIYGVHAIVPLVDAEKTVRPYSEYIASLLEEHPQTRWGMYRTYRARFIYYADHFTTVLQEPDELEAYVDQPGSQLLVLRVREYEQLKNDQLKGYTVLDHRKIGSRNILMLTNEPPGYFTTPALPGGQDPM
jgi:4-amino-4-deoxy-L-arabinose transferase-like glycosyltransferase